MRLGAGSGSRSLSGTHYRTAGTGAFSRTSDTDAFRRRADTGAFRRTGACTFSGTLRPTVSRANGGSSSAADGGRIYPRKLHEGASGGDLSQCGYPD